jgi:hypothetical protein
MNTEYRLDSKKIERNVLEAELPPEELWEDEEYQQLRQQIERLENELDDSK